MPPNPSTPSSADLRYQPSVPVALCSRGCNRRVRGRADRSAQIPRRHHRNHQRQDHGPQRDFAVVLGLVSEGLITPAGDVLTENDSALDKHQQHQGYAVPCRLSDRPGRKPQSVWSVSVPSTVDAALAPSGDSSDTACSSWVVGLRSVCCGKRGTT